MPTKPFQKILDYIVLVSNRLSALHAEVDHLSQQSSKHVKMIGSSVAGMQMIFFI